MSNQLSKSQVARYEELKAVARAGLETSMRTALALWEIKEQGLFRKDYDSFDAFLKEEMGISRKHGYRLIDYAEVIQDVSIGHKPNEDSQALTDETQAPNEHQARALKDVPAGERKGVWEEAKKTAPRGKVTAKHVEKVVAKRRTPEPAAAADEGGMEDQGFVDDDAAAAGKGKAGGEGPKDATGMPIEQEKVREAFADNPRFAELKRRHAEFVRDLLALANGAGGAYLDQQDVRIRCRDVGVLLDDHRPHAVCRKCGGLGCQGCKQTGFYTKYVWDNLVAKEFKS